MKILSILMLLTLSLSHLAICQKDTNPNLYHYPETRSKTAKSIVGMMDALAVKKSMAKDLKRNSFKDRSKPISRTLKKKYEVEIKEFDLHKAYRVAPKLEGTNQTIILIHGGAYIYGLQKIYWDYVDVLIQETGATVIIVDYPLAPKYSAVQAYEYMYKVYDWTLESVNPEDLTIIGDSAGGGMALGLAQSLRDQNKTMPKQLILLSPWLDITMSNPDIAAVADKDVVLTLEGLILAGNSYADELASTDYRLSPIYGNLQGLPPTSVFVTTDEVFYPDCLKLQTLLDENKVENQLYIYPGLFHDWSVVVSNLKESKSVLGFVKEKISASN